MLQKETVEPRVLELLRALQADSMFKHFHLAGGTGLALHLGHRRSADIDLFATQQFNNEEYLQYLEKKYRFEADYTALNTIKGSIEKLKVDFITHEYLLLMPIVEEENIRIYSKEDIAAMKINAIAGDGTRSKDFVDLYFLLNNYSISDLLGFFGKKYSQRNTFHALKSLNYFNEVNLADWPVMIKENNLSWREVKASINKKCKEYFETNLKN